MAALSSSAGLAVAGCLGDDDGDDDDGVEPTDPDELGEPVEDITIQTYTGLPAASEQEQVGAHIRDQLIELGVDASVQPKELVTMMGELASDAREHHIHLDIEPPFHQFIDPFTKLEAITAEKAGNNAFIHNSQYASCEYSNVVIDLAELTDPDEQQDLINEALSIASADVERLNFVNTISQSAYRTDQFEIDRPAAGGINDRAFEAFWNADMLEGDDIIMNIAPGNITDVAYQAGHYLAGWTHYPFSPLTYYDLDNQRQGNLAEDWEWSDDATTLTMYLREGQTFHNGDPLLADDVQWTYNWLNENAGALGLPSWRYESIEVEDDHRISFNFELPRLHFIHFTALYGILHPEQWIDAGAEEDPVSPDIPFDNIIGSGPYQVVNFEPESLLDMEPHPDHWADANTNMVFEGFADFEAARRAFMEGEINVFQNMGTADQEQIESEIPDVAEVFARDDIADWYVAFQNNYGPTKFRDFRLALSHALNRALMNELLAGGMSNDLTFSSVIPEALPSFPENPEEVLTYVADSTQPDFDQARQILSDAGFGWDDDGNLHYPQDADLDPLWPEGEQPSDYPEEWPCVEDLPP